MPGFWSTALSFASGCDDVIDRVEENQQGEQQLTGEYSTADPNEAAAPQQQVAAELSVTSPHGGHYYVDRSAPYVRPCYVYTDAQQEYFVSRPDADPRKQEYATFEAQTPDSKGELIFRYEGEAIPTPVTPQANYEERLARPLLTEQPVTSPYRESTPDQPMTRLPSLSRTRYGVKFDDHASVTPQYSEMAPPPPVATPQPCPIPVQIPPTPEQDFRHDISGRIKMAEPQEVKSHEDQPLNLTAPSQETRTDYVSNYPPLEQARKLEPPMFKKPKKQRPATGKLSKSSSEYILKRERNNIAVRKSREKAKQKYVDLKRHEAELEAANHKLEEKILRLSSEVQKLKDIYVSVKDAGYVI